jgi:membrane-associated phospholipid phosphatase
MFEKPDSKYFKRNLSGVQNISLIFLLLITLHDFSLCQLKSAKPFNLDFNREAALVGAGAVAAVTAFAILENLKPLTLEEIDLLEPSNVNGFDRGAIGPYKEDYFGDALLYASYAIPLSFACFSETRSDIWDLTLMYGEVLLLQSSINGIVKGTVQRVRPFVYDDQSPIDEKLTKSARISFFPGHTSMTAAITFFTARVATGYVESNSVRILIWTAAALLPIITSVSRVNTHWHFPTDVMAGYAIGALIGYFIPELHNSKSGRNGNLSIYPSMNIDKPALGLQLRF